MLKDQRQRLARSAAETLVEMDLKSRLFDNYLGAQELRDRIEQTKKGITIVMDEAGQKEVSSDESHHEVKPATAAERRDPNWREKRRKMKLKTRLMARIRKALKRRVTQNLE